MVVMMMMTVARRIGRLKYRRSWRWQLDEDDDVDDVDDDGDGNGKEEI